MVLLLLLEMQQYRKKNFVFHTLQGREILIFSDIYFVEKLWHIGIFSQSTLGILSCKSLQVKKTHNERGKSKFQLVQM